MKPAILARNHYLIVIFAFLLGGSSIADGAVPAGAAFFAAFSGSAAARLLTAAAVILGAALRRPLESVYVNAACLLLFSVFGLFARKRDPKAEKREQRLDIRTASLLFAASILPQLMLAAMQGFLIYDVLKSVFSSFVLFVLFFLFRLSIPIITGEIKKSTFSGEEAVSTAATAVLVLSGLGEMRVLGFSFSSMFGVLILLLFSYRCGAGTGAAAGAAIGLVTGISREVTPALTGSYAFCGMLAGILGNLGRTGSALGVVMGYMILASYLNGSTESMLYLKEILGAVLVFFLLPDKLIAWVTGPFIRETLPSQSRRGYAARLRETASERLKRFSNVFLELSRTFSEISGTKLPAGKQEIHVLFDRVADRVCTNCSLCTHCWELNFYDTYQVMFRIIEKLESTGRVEEKDIPHYFLEKCPKISEFVSAVNNMYELYRVGIVWKSRLNESRNVVSRQYEGMSKVILSLADEIGREVRYKESLEEDLLSRLHGLKLPVKEAEAAENQWGKLEITLLCSAEGASPDISTFEGVLSQAAGRKMVRALRESRKDGSGMLKLYFTEAEDLQLVCGIAKMPKSGSTMSGDSFTFRSCSGGKYLLALSDGMGSGFSAAAQSRAAVDMLESFLDSGFDKETAVNLINSALVLKAEEEISCTIDLSLVDLYSGEVEFVKTGAAPTYLKRGERVDLIRSASLPAGILFGIAAELAHRTVGSGDMIIMVTDGIIDSLSAEEQGDKRLLRFLQQMESLNPQQVADAILAEAANCADGKPADDLTVLVAKVWKRALAH